MTRRTPRTTATDTLFPYTTRFRSIGEKEEASEDGDDSPEDEAEAGDQADEDGDGDGAAGRSVPEKKKETIDRTDDPVRMYLREMGAVELLSREGEIAIAKRIEAGRDTMILGLCESPITFNAIIEWSTALNDGEMQLREILDRSEEHTSELQSLMLISYAVFCLKKKNNKNHKNPYIH